MRYANFIQVIEKHGAGDRIRTNDLRITKSTRPMEWQNPIGVHPFASHPRSPAEKSSFARYPVIGDFAE